MGISAIWVLAGSALLEVGGADLAEQAAQEPGELHERAVVADPTLGAALNVFERRHRVAHDAQVALPRDLALGLADAEQLSKAGSAMAREELESGHGHPCPQAYRVLIEQTLSSLAGG